jgi:hypothetical protein
MKAKKGVKLLFIGAAVILLALIALSIILLLSFEKDLLELYVEKKFSREVTTQEVNFGLLSAISGVRARQIVISNRWTEDQIKAEEVIPDKSVFIRLDTLNFRFSLIPLLKRSLVIKTLWLQNPEIRLIRHPDGSLNISDLMSYDTLYAEDLPLSISANSIAVKDGTALLQDQISNHRYSIQDLYLDFFDICVDPDDLEKKNSLKTRMGFTLQSLFMPADSFAEEITADFKVKGSIQPFDLAVRSYDPSMHLNVETPEGKAAGFKLIKKIKNLPLLGEFGVTLDFLNDTLEWKKGSIVLRYSKGILEFSEGKLETQGYSMKYSGFYNTETSTLDAELELHLHKRHTKTLETAVNKKAESIIPADLKKHISPEELSNMIISNMLDEESRIQLGFKVSGSFSQPQISMVSPSPLVLTSALKKSLQDKLKSRGADLLEGKVKNLLEKIKKARK